MLEEKSNMEFSQAPLQNLNEFVETRHKELKEATKQMKFWEKQTTVLSVKLDESRANFRFFEKKAASLIGSIATCNLIKVGKNAK